VKLTLCLTLIDEAIVGDAQVKKKRATTLPIKKEINLSRTCGCCSYLTLRKCNLDNLFQELTVPYRGIMVRGGP